MSKRKPFTHINNHGIKRYYSNREMTILHREDGPAIEYFDGTKAWYLNGECHREDGPAVEWANGYEEWYLNGEYLTEEEFNTHMNKK